MDIFHTLINGIAFSLNIIGALIVLRGVVIALGDFLKKEFSGKKDVVGIHESIRITLGSYLVLGLEFFIAGDIIKTIITPTWESLAILGAVVVIRTILSYFLTKELKKT